MLLSRLVWHLAKRCSTCKGGERLLIRGEEILCEEFCMREMIYIYKVILEVSFKTMKGKLG